MSKPAGDLPFSAELRMAFMKDAKQIRSLFLGPRSMNFETTTFSLGEHLCQTGWLRLQRLDTLWFFLPSGWCCTKLVWLCEALHGGTVPIRGAEENALLCTAVSDLMQAVSGWSWDPAHVLTAPWRFYCAIDCDWSQKNIFFGIETSQEIQVATLHRQEQSMYFKPPHVERIQK